MPLAGKKILITRPLSSAEPMAQLLRERGAVALFFPTIQIGPPVSWEACDEAIDQYRTYDALIITSVNAAKYFLNRAMDRGLRPGLMPHSKIYVVGPKTAEAVAYYGIAAARFPGVTNVRMLSDALCATPVSGKRFLFPKGNLAASEISTALRAQHAVVDEVIVYETTAGTAEGTHVPAIMDVQQVLAMLQTQSIDAITFFSPSSVENFFAVVPLASVCRTALAAIGSTTAEALRTLSPAEVVVPKQPTSENLVSGLEQYFMDKETRKREHVITSE